MIVTGGQRKNETYLSSNYKKTLMFSMMFALETVRHTEACYNSCWYNLRIQVNKSPLSILLGKATVMSTNNSDSYS